VFLEFCANTQGRGRLGSLNGEINDWHVCVTQDVEIRRRIAAELIGGAKQQDTAVVAADFKVAGDDESIAGVVAFAAEDDDGAVDTEALEHIDTAAAGIFHEHEAGDAALFDRTAIELAGLLACENGRVHSASVVLSLPSSAKYCATCLPCRSMRSKYSRL
jgi:hypothetical protein